MMPTGISSMPARTLKLRGDQEVEVGLLELELAGLLEAFDEGVLQLEFADEADPVREPVGDQQHEAVEVELGVLIAGLL